MKNLLVSRFSRHCPLAEGWLLAALLLHFVPARAFAQNLPQGGVITVVTLRVIDDGDQSVEGADVRLSGLGRSFGYRDKTSHGGTVVFQIREQGEFNIEIIKEGYETLRDHIDVILGQSVNALKRIHLVGNAPAGNTPRGPVSAASLAIPAAALKEFQAGMAELSKDLNASVGHFRAAIALYPKYADAYTMMGLALKTLKQTDEARAALTKAIELNPKLSTPHTLLGKLELEQKNFNKAGDELLASLRLDPHPWQVHFELARLYYNLGDFDKALQSARDAQAAPSAPSKTHLLLVDIYSHQGDKANALKELEAFAGADPNSPLMPRVKEMMEQLRQGG